MNDVTRRVIGLITKHFGVDDEKVVPAARFQPDLGADSLDIVELIMAVEDEFEINIPDEAADKIETVQDAVGYVENALKA